MPDDAWWRIKLKIPKLSDEYAPCRALWSHLFTVAASNTARPGVFEFGSTIQTDGYGLRILYESHRLEPTNESIKQSKSAEGKPERVGSSKVTSKEDAKEAAFQLSIEKSCGAKYVSSDIDISRYKRLIGIDPNLNDLMFGLSVRLDALVSGENRIQDPNNVDAYLTRVNTIETRRRKQRLCTNPIDRDITYFRNTYVDLRASRW
jgi:hypothetical protein